MSALFATNERRTDYCTCRTDVALRTYLAEFFLINVTDAELDKVLRLYPQDPTQGSPFDTGTQNTLTPEFKRIASLLGDLNFQAPRRFFLDSLSGKQNAWSYCKLHRFPSLFAQLTVLSYAHVDSHIVSKRQKSLPILGSAHSSDISVIYGGGDLTDYLIHFTNNLNPNGASLPQWPEYSNSSPKLLTLYDSPISTNITLDTYRAEGMKIVTSLLIKHPE